MPVRHQDHGRVSTPCGCPAPPRISDLLRPQMLSLAQILVFGPDRRLRFSNCPVFGGLAGPAEDSTFAMTTRLPAIDAPYMLGIALWIRRSGTRRTVSLGESAPATYSTYAKATASRRDNLRRTADELRAHLANLKALLELGVSPI